MSKNLISRLRGFTGAKVPARGSCHDHEERAARRSKGWIGEALEMLRADVTNVDYLTHGFCRR